APPPDERRGSSRKLPKPAVKATLHAGAVGEAPDLAIALLDLSQSGACFATLDSMRPRQEVEVTLRGFAHPRPIRLPAEVVWCMQAPSGTYVLAVAFAQRLSPEEWHKLT